MENNRFKAAIALGGNVGDVQRTFKRALSRLDKHDEITLLRRSDWIETAAVGGPAGQPNFMNGAIVVETTLSPESLLETMNEVETHFGRDRATGEPMGPRTLDLDLLLYADQIVQSDRLTIPHPRMAERRFVLEPLAQIDPEWEVPGASATVNEWLQELPEECSL